MPWAKASTSSSRCRADLCVTGFGGGSRRRRANCAPVRSRLLPFAGLLAAALGAALVASSVQAASSQSLTCLGKRATRTGTSGNDRISGTAKRDVIAAGEGNDVIKARGGRDIVCGGAGEDTLTGGAGSDELSGDGGDDRLQGGAGLDYAVYEESPTGVRADLARGSARGWGTDAFEAMEALIGSRQSDTFRGSGRGNYLAGLEGADDITAGAGNDYIDGGRGADRLQGGDGYDTVDFFFSRQGVTASLASGNARGYGRDRISNVEDLDGSRFRDVLIGNASPNWIRGFAGDDIIVAGAGRDRAEGGIGDDRIRGGLANDRISGGPGRDRLSGGRGRDRLSGGVGRDRCTNGERLIGCP
jgi:Ca2+-binding RTX toxin-like protein